MKTRIIWTKIWEDQWFDGLSQEARWLFIYLITNSAIGLSGYYELRDKTICYHTHLTSNQLLKAKDELYPKVRFHQGWVYILNAESYNSFRGEKLATARDREQKEIPTEIKTALNQAKQDRVSIPNIYPTDTPNNHIINNNINNIYKSYLEKWNEVYGTKYVSHIAIQGNLDYWMKTYTIDQIKEAIPKIKQDPYWKDKDVSPEWLLRTKERGEPIDRIGRMLNSKPAISALKPITKGEKEAYELSRDKKAFINHLKQQGYDTRYFEQRTSA